jgi:hypothetical protein
MIFYWSIVQQHRRKHLQEVNVLMELFHLQKEQIHLINNHFSMENKDDHNSKFHPAIISLGP